VPRDESTSVQWCCRQTGLRAIATHRGYVPGCLLARVSRARPCRPYTCNLSRDVEKKSVAYARSLFGLVQCLLVRFSVFLAYILLNQSIGKCTLISLCWGYLISKFLFFGVLNCWVSCPLIFTGFSIVPVFISCSFYSCEIYVVRRCAFVFFVFV
jgi:hypothetical protein